VGSFHTSDDKGVRRTAAIGDDARDLGDLCEREGPPSLWRAVFAYAQDRAVTDDAVAEAFAQCLGAARRFGAHRRGCRRPRCVWVSRAQGAASAPARLPTPRSSRATSARRIWLLAALRWLSGNQHAALMRSAYASYGTDEIARMFGSSRTTVRVHLSRGRRRLRTLLEKAEG
jgi:DNA-directed RNA polymerase specialized sigma24 family protein